MEFSTMEFSTPKLPKIGCNGYFFTPKAVSDKTYIIPSPMQMDRCYLNIGENRHWNQKEVDLSASIFPIDKDLKIMHSTEERSTWAMLGMLVSTVVSAYLIGIQRNYKLGGSVGAVFTGGCALIASYYNMQCRKASFDAANKVITFMLQKSDLAFKPADYGLS